MIRVCIAGVTGWTGRAVADAVGAADDMEPSRAWRAPTRRVSRLSRGPSTRLRRTCSSTTPTQTSRENVLAALERGVHVVVGSSGLIAEDYAEIDALARERAVGVIAAGNFSVTAALLLRLATEAARHLDAWEVIDYASAGKPDAPSGTSRELAERLESVRRPRLGVPLDQVVGAPEARGATVAGTQVHSLRLPSFVVSTEIVFAAERATRAATRRGGDAGALRGGDAPRRPLRAGTDRPDPRPRPAAVARGPARPPRPPVGCLTVA